MKCLPAFITCLVVLAGCESMLNDNRLAAQKQWEHVRAEAACDRAVDHLDVGQLDKAGGKARESLELDEDYHPARIVLAKVLIEQGRYQAAAAELEKVLGDEPDSAEALFLASVAYEKVGDLPKALSDYRRAYELDETNFNAVLAATEVLVAMDRTAEAARYLSGHIHKADNDPAAYELAGRLAMMQQAHERAATYYRRAYELDGENLAYLEALATAQVFAKRHADAIYSLSARLRQIEPPAPTWVYTMLGDCYLAVGAHQQACEVYRELCQLKPDDATHWVALAKANLAAGNLATAINTAERALQVDPDSVDATGLLGYALLLSGRGREATTVLTAAVAAHPQDVTLRCILGRSLETAGDRSRAEAAYREAVRIEPQNALAWALLRDASANASALP